MDNYTAVSICEGFDEIFLLGFDYEFFQEESSDIFVSFRRRTT